MDFDALDASYSIYPDNTTIRIPVTILTDTLDENREQFVASLRVNDGFEDQVMVGPVGSTDVNIDDGNSMLYLKLLLLKLSINTIFYIVVTFSIDLSSEDVQVPEQNESVQVCFSRMGDTVNDYSVTLEAKMNTAGNIANGNLATTSQL